MGDPIRITADQEKRLLDYIAKELPVAERDVLAPLQEKRKEWDDLYYGVTKPRRAAWLSNFPVLMGATFTDAVSARLLNTTMAYKPTWVLEPTRDSEWKEVAREVEHLLDFKVRVEMKLFRALRKTLFEATRLGMGVMLTPWIEETKTVRAKRLFWSQTLEVPTVNGIVTQYMPLRDFLYPGGYSELEELSWWARKVRWIPMELEVQKARKYYDNVDKIKKLLEPIDEEHREAQERSGEQTGSAERIHGREIYIKFPLKRKGELERYVVTVPCSASGEIDRTIMRIEEDTYPRWPIQIFRYGPRDTGLTGLGVIEMTAPFDNALWALYNLLVDNFNISTMQVFKGIKGQGLRADTKVYPGKLFLLNNPEKDLMPMAMGAPFMLNPAFTRLIHELGERRAGVSDYALGRESPIASGRATATGTLALIQEGQRRFDLIISDIRASLDDLGMFTLEMMHDRMPRNVPYMVLGEKGAWVERFLRKPGSSPYLSLNVISSVSNVALNKEIKKQDATATLQLLEKYYQGMIQLMMLMANPQLPDVMRESISNIANATSDKVKDTLAAYGEMVPEQYTEVMEPITGPRGAPPSEEAPVGGESEITE